MYTNDINSIIEEYGAFPKLQKRKSKRETPKKRNSLPNGPNCWDPVSHFSCCYRAKLWWRETS
jgi:hypothetical protein